MQHHSTFVSSLVAEIKIVCNSPWVGIKRPKKSFIFISFPHFQEEVSGNELEKDPWEWYDL